MAAPDPTTENHSQEYQRVAVGELNTEYASLRLPNPEAVAALTRSIARHGVLHPLTVNREPERLSVLDGFKRVRALADTPDALVSVRIVELTPAQAKAALLTFNRPHRGMSELEEGWIVQALVRDHKMRQTAVAALLGRHKSWVCRRLQLVERLDKGVVEDMRLGLVSATIARELVRLPRGNQARVGASIQQHSLTSRQSAELIRRVLKTKDDQGVDELLEDPMRFLDAPSGSDRKRDARLSDSGETLRQTLERLAKQAHITNQVIHSPSAGLLVTSDIELLRPRVRDVVGVLRLIDATLKQFLGEADNA